MTLLTSRTLLTSSDVKFLLVKVGPIIFTIAGIVADRSSSDVCCTKYSFKSWPFLCYLKHSIHFDVMGVYLRTTGQALKKI